MENISVQNKIELLIRQLEEEVERLSSVHAQEIKRLKETSQDDLRNLTGEQNQYIIKIEELHKSEVLALKREVDYLQELNASQRVMMEDNLDYIKKLESRLNSSSSTD